MDLRQLEIVRRVAELGSFTAAARALHVSQSAISRQVLLLEDELGEPAFLRLGRTVRLTTAGQALLDLSHRVLSDVHETTASIRDQQQAPAGTLHLGGGMTVCLHVFPALLKEFRRTQPRIDVKLTTGATPQLLERLRSGALDVGLLTLPVAGADLTQVPVMREELLLVMHPTHRLARRRTIAPGDLVNQSWVLFERGSSTRRVIDETFDRHGIRPRIVMETENVEILKALTTIGMGLTILPYQALAREARSGALRVRRIAGVTMVRETGWVYVRGARVPRVVQHMFDALKRTVPRLKLAPPAR
ncbi:MAG TPA: LysR family transcriptional regulator [Vicinamibacterales bacterium]|nr:LysR family transcriptional regulator [Vicinamibacterales bacterium]